MSKEYIKELIEMGDDALNVELENVPVGHFRNLLKIALKEQDRDTRHACAEAVVQIGLDSTAICEISDRNWVDKAHFACMNVKAV